MRPLLFPAWVLLFSLWTAQAQELRLPLPKKSKYTPSQQLNRDGVQALKKHDIDKAKRCFYRAYLVDPDDPFTLNNLGYISEMEGDIDRAQRYYDQARANTSDAVVDRSTEERAVGQPVVQIAGHTEAGPLKVNQLNSEAVSLLNHDRAPEADVILQKALKIDPKDPFTLNNMGFAKENEGELEEAVQYYNQSAATGSREPVIVTLNKSWRGKPVSEIAAQNAGKARRDLAKSEDVRNRVARLNLRGVSAMNRNDRKAAREYFQQAYRLDPQNAFVLNNMGYLAEWEGDKETAQLYYEQAHNAERAGAKVAASTRPETEGRPLAQVAAQSNDLVEARMEAEVAAKRSGGGAPALRTRDNRIVVDKPAPAQKPEATPPGNPRQDPPALQQRSPE